MEEAMYSANWKMFNSEGVSEQFTVRGDDHSDFMERRDALIAALLASGLTWTEQAKKEVVKGQYETDKVIGYFVTAIQTGPNAGQPSVSCYNGRSKFVAYTLYKEDAHLLPAPWPTEVEFDGSTPEKDVALTHRKFHKVSWDLPITPKINRVSGEVVKKNGYVVYIPDRTATLDGAKKLPDVGKTSAGSVSGGTSTYTHKRAAPEHTAPKPGTCAEFMVDDDRTEWWMHLTPQQQDVVSYARAFVRTYNTNVPAGVMHGPLLSSVMAELQRHCITIAVGAGMEKPSIDAVTAYASQLLSDVAGTDAESVPYGVSYWLASCLKEKDAKGKANPLLDIEWVKAFAEAVVRVIAAEGMNMDDIDELAF